MKRFLSFFALVFFAAQSHATLLYWNTNGTGATWTTANWGSSSSGPFTTAWTSGSDVDFAANSTITFASTGYGNVTVENGFTVAVTQGGTASGSNVHTFDIGTGSTLTWTSQTYSANTTQGYIKNGAGTLNLNALSYTTMTGGVTLNAGTLIITGAKSLGSGTVNFNGGTLQTSGSLAFTLPTSITIGGDFSFAGIGNDSYSAAVALGSSTRTITNSTTGTATRTFSGIISGSGGFNFVGTGGSGGVVLSGANAYTGGTTVSAGTVTVAATTGSLASTGALAVNGGTINLNNTAGQTISALSGSGGTIALASGVNLNVNQTASTTFSGVLSGLGSLTKANSGTLALSGANTYTGATTVSAGTLSVNGSTASGSAVSVGASGTLGGTGTVGGATTVTGNIAPGNSVGNLTFSNGLTLNSGSTYVWELGSLTTSGGGSNFDLITISGGSLTLVSGANLSLFLGSLAPQNSDPFWTSNHAWTIITTPTSITGTGLAVDNSAWSSHGSFVTGVNGNNLDLNWTAAAAIPEPSTYAAILGVVVLTGVLIRRRRLQSASGG